MTILNARHLRSLLVATGLLTGLGPQLLAAPPTRATPPPELPHMAGQLIVKFKPVAGGPGATPSLQALHLQYGLRRIENVFPPTAAAGVAASQRWPQRQNRAAEGGAERARVLAEGFGRTFLLHFDQKVDLKAALASYQKDPGVEYAELNTVVKLALVPNDPFFSSQGTWGQPYKDMWGLHVAALPQAWDVTQGTGVVVAVVDTGLDYNHDDIDDNVWANTREIAGNGIDDDQNGYVDDTRGWDTVTCDDIGYDSCHAPRPPDNDPMDRHGHGTHVSGTIAAEGNNGLGVVGVAFRAKVMPVKGINDRGQGLLTNLAEALYYAANNGADVINNSWVGEGPSQHFVEEAVAYAQGLGAVVVAAAGNDGNLVWGVPAGIPSVVTVAASDTRDRIAPFSNYSAVVDLSAPGVDILSLRAEGTDMYGGGTQIVGEVYYRASGTSMAAPHVAGAAALLISAFPSLGIEEIRDRLYFKSDNIDWTNPSYAGQIGAGRLNVNRALTEVLDPPVLSISGRVTDGQAQPLGGVRIRLWGAAGFPQAVSAPDGTYALTGLRGGKYRAVPTLSGHDIDPALREYSLKSDQINQNFVAIQKWDIQTLVYGARAGEQGNSIAVDAQNRPHITYHTDDQDFFYTKWTGSSWETEPIELHDSGFYHPGRQSSLALDSSGQPHVSYHAENPGPPYGYAKYARRTSNGGWYVAPELEIYPPVPDYTDTSLVLDAAQRPHMIYINRSRPYVLYYARWDGAAWQKQVIDQGPATYRTTTQNGLALDSQGRPHVVYHTVEGPPARSTLKYATFDGTSWRISVVDQNLGLAYGESAIVLDAQDRPRIAYVAPQQESVKYATWNGTAWVLETVGLEYQPNQSYYRTDLSLVLGPDQAPHLLYWAYNLRYATKKDGVWKVSNLHAGYAGVYHQLAIDSQGFLHASYWDWDTEQFKYARSRFSVNPSLRVVTPTTGTTWVTGSTQTISWQAENVPAGAWVGTLRLWMDTVPVAEIRPPNGQQFPPTGFVQWTVPATIPAPFDYYLIQAELKSGANGGPPVLAEAWSRPFRIVRPKGASPLAQQQAEGAH